MAVNGWSGPDPVLQNEGVGVNLELATRYVASADISISGVRVWSDDSVNVPERKARIWTADGVELAEIELDDTLPGTGWTTYGLATAIEIHHGTIFDVSYSTTQYYGVLGDATAAYPRVAADDNVVASRGRYTTVLGEHPVNVSDSFYGVDFVYSAVSSPGGLLIDASESWIDDIFDAVVSDAQASGYFDKVNQHEPKRPPGNGLTAAVWIQAIDPLPQGSGLNSTSGRLTFTLRIYAKMLTEPQDMIDLNMTRAAVNLMRRYHDDFDFEGNIRNVDLLGQFGVALASKAGYVNHSGEMYRIQDITIPCIVNDIWPQVR